jgi:hypothetical protein
MNVPVYINLTFGPISHPFPLLMLLKISPTPLNNRLFSKQNILITDYGLNYRLDTVKNI